jgi:flagellar motor component MotA
MREERELQARREQEALEEKKREHLIMQTQFKNKKEGQKVLNQQLEMLREKYQKGLQALEDKKDECARMREEIQDYIREYTREIKLKEILIKNFIPEEEVVKVAKIAVWNNEIEEYVLKK